MSRVLQAVDSIHSVGLYCLGMQKNFYFFYQVPQNIGIVNKPYKQGAALDMALSHHRAFDVNLKYTHYCG